MVISLEALSASGISHQFPAAGGGVADAQMLWCRICPGRTPCPLQEPTPSQKTAPLFCSGIAHSQGHVGG